MGGQEGWAGLKSLDKSTVGGYRVLKWQQSTYKKNICSLSVLFWRDDAQDRVGSVKSVEESFCRLCGTSSIMSFEWGHLLPPQRLPEYNVACPRLSSPLAGQLLTNHSDEMVSLLQKAKSRPLPASQTNTPASLLLVLKAVRLV